MSRCNLCPRRCNADRSSPVEIKRSICRGTDTVEIALVSLHAWEEPVISGKTGAGTVFSRTAISNAASARTTRSAPKAAAGP